ncbi:hypothetical protein EGJ53_06035 [Pseudomonas fluorescens]|nr:hypothetical protein EGJ53_06035 [Pseudomonas fluorescens]TDK56909.1 hypothetical protein E1508_06545 [Pseudomonas moraviensis]
MGASLLANALQQSTLMQADPPLSRASSLPQLDLFPHWACGVAITAPCNHGQSGHWWRPSTPGLRHP